MNKDLPSMLLDKVIKIGEDVSSIKTTINEHDRIFKDIKDTLVTIDSKHNQDYLQYIATKEELKKKVEPMWDDFMYRKDSTLDTKKNLKRLFFSVVQWVLITGMAIMLGYHELKTK